MESSPGSHLTKITNANYLIFSGWHFCLVLLARHLHNISQKLPFLLRKFPICLRSRMPKVPIQIKNERENGNYAFNE